MTLDIRERVYNHDEWAVRRWDALHDGIQVEPKSFCQFWRTVYIWCTLMKLPFIGKWFKESAPPEIDWDAPPVIKEKKEPSWLAKAMVKLGELCWLLFYWTIALPFRGLWWVFSATAVYFSDRPHIGAWLKKTITRVFDITIFAVMILSSIGLMALVFWGLYTFGPDILEGGLNYYPILAGGAFGIVFAVLLVATRSQDVTYVLNYIGHVLEVFFLFIWRILCGIGNFIKSVLHLIIDIAITNKKHICPPMRIRRG